MKLDKKNLLGKIDSEVKAILSKKEFDIECPYCKFKMTAKQGKFFCPSCKKEINVSFNIN